MSKQIILDNKYILGGGFGSWAKSKETVTVTKGDTRVIGGILMYAYTIYPAAWYNLSDGRDEVNWCPVDRDICHDAEKMRQWVGSVNDY